MYSSDRMVLDTIKLGAKRPQGKSLSSAKLRGLFYAGRWGRLSSLVARQPGKLEVATGKPRSGTDRQAGFESRPFPLKAGNLERCPAPATPIYG